MKIAFCYKMGIIGICRSEEEMKDNFDEKCGEYIVDYEKNEAYENWLKSGKDEINKLLYEFLPGNTTIDEMETVACSIHNTISGWWEHKTR